MSITTDTETVQPGLPERSLWQSMKRGLGQTCPNCGTGKLFGKYLKVQENCDHCGEELHHQRADDAPPYITIFIVGHIIVAALLYVEKFYAPPIWVHMALWLPLTLVMSLWLLQPIKGAIVGLQWANRMHGFGGEDDHSFGSY